MQTILNTLAVWLTVASLIPSFAAAAENRHYEDTVLDAASGREDLTSGIIQTGTPIKIFLDDEPRSPILLVKDADDTGQEVSEYLESQCCGDEDGAIAESLECLNWRCGAGITGGTLGGSVTGAGAGAGVGALVTGANPVGAAIGSVIGGVVGAVAGGLGGYAATPACGPK